MLAGRVTNSLVFENEVASEEFFEFWIWLMLNMWLEICVLTKSL